MSETTREKNKKRLLDLLSQQICFDCGLDDWRLLTWDHRDPKKKKGTISSLAHAGSAWSLIERELAKVDPVCYNCHARRELERGNGARQQLWEQQQNGKRY